MQLAYWLCLGGGLALFAGSVLFDATDLLDIDVAGGDVDIIPVLLAGVAAFGGGGLVGVHGLGLGSFGSTALGVVVGVVFAALTAMLFLALHRVQGRRAFQLDQLVGVRGHATLALGPGRVGRVSVKHDGMTRTLTASSTEEIGAGEEVVVSDVVGHQLNVVRADTLGLPGPR